MTVATFLASADVIKGACLLLVSMALTSYKYPVHKDVTTNSTFDYIIVGAGTAGCVLANRLTEQPGVSVLLIEAGPDPTLESEMPAVFPYLTKTSIDWNLTAEDDGYTAQNTPNKYLDLPSGKGLGGSSMIHHHYHVRGHSSDYDPWVTAGDESWSYKNLLPYFIRSENVKDAYIMNSEYADYHGTNGPIGVTVEDSDRIDNYLKAFEEVGNNIVKDINNGETIGYARPMYSIADGTRQSSSLAYLKPIKDRSNLHVMKNTLVTKIVFNSDNEATGVQCMTSDGTNKTMNANKEVILSAGAFGTPKLLMLSGIGPSEHLTSLNISLVSNLPVGKTMQDHMGVIMFHVGENTTETPPSTNPGEFPIPSFIGLSAINKTQTSPDYFSLNLLCDNVPSALYQLSSLVFSLADDVCDEMYTLGTNRRTIFSVLAVGRPASNGLFQLRSTTPTDAPIIYTGFASNDTDLEKTAECIEDFVNVTQSTYFQSVGGKTHFFNLTNCNSTSSMREYWKCYALNMMGTTFHYSSTCPMGPVLDSNLLVRGVTKLRVADASALPNLTNGNINAVILALAEKAADLIKKSNCYA